MSHKRIPKRKAAIAAGGVVALGAAAILLPHANASQDHSSAATAPKTLKATAASDLATRLAGALGDAYAGSYYDSASQQLVVNVVSGSADHVVVEAKKAGAKVRQVPHSTAQLAAAAQVLKAKATIPGTSWAVDPKTDRIQVTADSTVTGAKWDTLTSTVKSLGTGMAAVHKTSGALKPLVAGGDAIFAQTDAGGVRCSLGFNVTAGDGTPAFLTAGHCGVAAKEWSDSETGQPIATVDQANFPGDGDFSLVKYDDPATQTVSEVNVGNGQTVQITGAVDATVGETVFRMGSTSGLHDGQVTALDATVNFQSETDPNAVDTVTGLIQTDVCAEAGDSGGSLFTQDGGAVGLTSGGSGDCTSGGQTFFQPVTTALTATGATLGDGGAGTGDGSATADPSATAADPSATAADPSATAADPAATAGDASGTGAEDGSGLTSAR